MAKTTAATSVAKPKIKVEPIREYVKSDNASDIKLDGWVFSWQNLSTKRRKGWGIHNAVERDSELGGFVAEQFGVSADKFLGQNDDTNYFLKGGDTILCYTSQEIADKQILKDEEAADKQMASVGDGAELQRHVMISKGIRK